MLTYYIKILSLSAFILLSGIVYTQQNIPISDSLAFHAETLELTKGYISGKKIKKFHFGEYSMHTYKQMPTKAWNKENLFGTMSSSEYLYTSSFMFSNSAHDTAQVFMFHQIQDKKQNNLVTGIIQFGEKKLLNSDFFTSWITINRNTTEKWTLFFGKSSGQEVEYMQTAYLSNDVRTISLKLIRGREKGKNILGWPAMGYEFYEEGKSLAAIQFFNDKLFPESYTVWKDQRLDAKTKFLLATAMTAILYEPDESNE